MEDLIKKWKAEHVAIKNALAFVAERGVCDKACLGKMRETKDMILKHLHSEDDVLYPMLKKAARKNVDMARMMEVLKKEMDELAPKIIAIFTEFENDPASGRLSADFNTIAGLLRSRIDREEAVLLKDYNQAR